MSKALLVLGGLLFATSCSAVDDSAPPDSGTSSTMTEELAEETSDDVNEPAEDASDPGSETRPFPEGDTLPEGEGSPWFYDRHEPTFVHALAEPELLVDEPGRLSPSDIATTDLLYVFEDDVEALNQTGVTVVERATGESVDRLEAVDPDRFISKILFHDGDRYVAHSHPSYFPEGESDTRVFRLNAETGDEEELIVPDKTWDVVGSHMLVSGDGVYFTSVAADRSFCVYRIDDEEPQQITCLSDYGVAGLGSAETGVNATVFPLKGADLECRHAINVSDDGQFTLVGNDDSCRALGGITVQGWDIWHQLPDIQGPALNVSALLVDGPDGERFSLGQSETGSILTCGDSVFWIGESRFSDEVSQNAVYEWQFGSAEASEIWTGSQGMQADIACGDSELLLHVSEPDHGDWRYLYAIPLA